MSIVDILIIAIILICAFLGFKRGLIHSLVAFVGTILIVVLSFTFKNYVSIILYENLPFLKFTGFFKNVSVLNILFYELLAFLILMIVLTILLSIIIKVSKIIEKILKATIILGIPSKIAGGIIGLIEGYIICFVLLYIFSLSIVNVPEMKNSKYRAFILEETPLLASLNENTTAMINDFESLKESYNGKDAEEFNLKSLDLFLKYDIISIDSVDKLIEKDKLKINNIESVLEKYRDSKKEPVEILEDTINEIEGGIVDENLEQN
jgi:uncharacterized membrane protein required for colicin V production